MSTPDWMKQEEDRAEVLTEKQEVSNQTAPQLVRVKREPARKQKPFYIQDSHAKAFDLLVFKQKQINGKKSTHLAEEAIELLLAKYGETL